MYYHGYDSELTIEVIADPNEITPDKNGVYQIKTADQLLWFANYSNYINNPWDANVILNAQLNADIDLKGKPWTPINKYFGTFNGNGKIIKNLSFESDTYYAAMFLYLYGTIQNLGIEDCNITTMSEAAGICYQINGGGKISGCYVTGNIHSNYCAGICLGLNYEATIENCYSLCTLTNESNEVPKSIVRSDWGGTITSCYGNTDYNPNQYSDYVTLLSTKELCNGNLPEGLSSNDWNVGSVSGSTYTFPQLKVFGNHKITATIPTQQTIVYPPALYSIGDEISFEGMKIGRIIPGTSSLLDEEELTSENTTVTGFSTTKTGTFTAKIKCNGVTAEYTYRVSAYDKPEYYSYTDGLCDIYTASQLMWFAEYANYVNNKAEGHIYNDIILNENLVEKVKKGQTSNLLEWTPIGTKENPFEGYLYFDNTSNSISGLYINKPTMDYVGLFGYTKHITTSENFTITDSYINGNNYVGGLFGYTDYRGNWTFNNSSISGYIAGNNYVGGIIGGCNNNYYIMHSYINAEISSQGSNSGIFFGTNNEDNTFFNCYYNSKICALAPAPGITDSKGEIEGHATIDFNSGAIAYLLSTKSDTKWGQDLFYNNSTPFVLNGEEYQYIVHANPDGTGYHNPVFEEDGRCSICIPTVYPAPQKDDDGTYIIANKNDLLGFMQLLLTSNISDNAKLTDDIEFNDIWYTGTNSYFGKFDGQYHTITGLKSDNTNGMFYYIDNDETHQGEVTNLILKNTSFSGIHVGGIACFNDGKITNCVFDGEINATNDVGGIVMTNRGTISGCINAGTINSSQSYAGGIAAITYNYDIIDPNKFIIENCYNTGTINSPHYYASGIFATGCGVTIRCCYNTGKINANSTYSVSGAWNGGYGNTLEYIFNNSDVCNGFSISNYDNYNGYDLSSEELCNSKQLPEGFSSDIWSNGYIKIDEDGTINYTFPHLKAFKKYPAYVIEETKEKEIVDIELIKPTKTEYVQTEELDLTGGYIVLHYNFGDDETIQLTDEDIIVDKLDHNSLGEQYINVIYKNKDAGNFHIYVSELEITDKIFHKPTKTTYNVGDVINLEDGYFEIKYNDPNIEGQFYLSTGNTYVSGFNTESATTNQEVSVSCYSDKFGNLSASYTIDVKARTVTNLSVTSPSNTTFYVTHALPLKDFTLNVTYNDGTIDNIPLDDPNIKLSEYDYNTPSDDVSITVSFGGKLTSFSVKYIDRDIYQVSILKYPSNTTCETGDELDLTGGKLLVKYTNTDQANISMDDDDVTIIGFDNTQGGSQNIKLKYKGVDVDGEITVMVTKSNSNIDYIKVTKTPKTEYTINDNLDITGGEITVYYSDGTTVPYSFDADDVKASPLDKSIINEDQEIFVEFQGFRDSYKVKIIHTITKFEFTAPTKQIYLKGQPFSINGATLEIGYNNGDEDWPYIDEDMFSGYDPNKEGEQTITFTYEDKSETFKITVITKIVSNVEFTAPTKRTYIEGQEFDITGASLRVVFNTSNGEWEDVTITKDMFTGFNSSTPVANQVITLKYMNITKTFNITINAKSITDLVMVKKPTTTTFVETQDFDATGAQFKITYDNGTEDKINLEGISFSGYAQTVGTHTITATYNGKSTTFDVNVVALAIDKIAVKTAPAKLEYKKGETLDINDGVLLATFNDGSTQDVTFADAEITEFDNTTIGSQTLTIKYQGKTTFIKVIVISEKEISSIAVSKQPTTTVYHEGESLDLDGGELTITYSDKSTDKLDLSDGLISVTGYSSTKIGEQTLTIKYGNKETSLKVTVKAKAAETIAVTTMPTKVEYIENQVLDLKGGIITVTYNNDETVTAALDNKDVTVTGYDATKIGKQTIKVEYLEKETTFEVTVNAKSVVSIAVTTAPTTEYIEGATFSAANGVITITYDNGETSTVALDKATLTGYDAAKIGKQTITVTYLEKTTKFEVTVKAKTLVSIAITTAPKTTYTQGDALSTANGVITATYDNGTTATIALEKATLSGYDANKIGKQTITAEYLGKTATFDITVEEKKIEVKPVSIEVSTLPTTTEYTVGEALNINGGKITVKYNNGTTQEVELDKATISGFDTNKEGEQTITVEYLDLKASFTVTVKAKTIEKTVAAIEVSTLPTKTSYKAGEQLDLAGGKITVKYSDATTEEADLAKATVTGFDSNKAGKQTLQVSYLDKTASFDVTVTEEQKTPVSEINGEGDAVKVWSFARTIYIETAADTKYTIVDLNGRMITTSTTKSTHEEIQVNGSGIYVVIINGKSYKVSASR